MGEWYQDGAYLKETPHYAQLPIKVRKRCPPTSCAFRLQKTNTSFPINVMLKRNAFEIKIK